MIARFRVATRATGVRRTIHVHVYDDRDELRSAHAKYRDREPVEDVGGAVVITSGFRWPRPETQPGIVMLLWTGQLTTRTIAHEATHAAAYLAFMDDLTGWDSRARTYLIGDHEPMAYAVGDIASEVIRNLYRLRLLPVLDRPSDDIAGDE